MTITSEINKNQYSCNGAQVVFPYTFLIFDADHLLVVHRDAAGAETILDRVTDYTVSDVGEPSGGDVTTVATYPADTTLTIARNVPETQLTDYIENDIFPAEVHERALDKITMMVQELSESVERSLRVSVVDVSPDVEIPNAMLRANRLLGFDANGDVGLYMGAEEIFHNELSGLQGGTTGEYYHLTASEKSLIGASAGVVTVGDSSNKMVIDTTGDRIHIVADGIICLDLNADLDVYTFGELTSSGIVITGLGNKVELFSGVLTELTVDADGMTLKAGASVNEILTSVGSISEASTDDQLATAKLIYDSVLTLSVTAVEAAGLTLASTKVIDSADEDIIFNFGRGSVVGSGDQAIFAHRDKTASTEYAFKQDAVGHTYVNAGTGKTVKIRINNGNIQEVDILGTYLNTLSAGVADYDKFVVADPGATNLLKYRTGAEVLSDIGGAASAHLHDTQTLNCDGITSDGGTFYFTTSAAIKIAQTLEMNCVNPQLYMFQATNDWSQILRNGTTKHLDITHRVVAGVQGIITITDDGYIILDPTTSLQIPALIGVNVVTPLAQLHIDQDNDAAAIPVLKLDQADIDDSFIDFIGTSAADGTRSISLDTTQDSTKYGAVRIEINGVTKWIRIYDNES